MGKKKTASTSPITSKKVLGIISFTPQREEVHPEPSVEGVIIIRGPGGLDMKVRNPKRVLEILSRYKGSRVVS